MSQSATAPKIHASPDWFHFDQPPDPNHLADLLAVLDLNELTPHATKMLSMTKFDGSSAASRWLRVLEEELPDQLSPVTWLKRADARLDGRAAAWAERTPEVIRILSERTIGNATAEDKDMFIRLLSQEFPGNQSNVITEERASTELSSLTQKEDEDHYTYYRRIEVLLTGIAGRDRVTHDGENAVILNRAEQHILKDTITKFIFGLRDPDLRLRMIEYRVEPARSLYGAFKKAEAHILVLDAKLQMDKEHDLKVGYEAFKSFQTSVAAEQNTRPQS